MMKNSIFLKDLNDPFFTAKVPDNVDKYWFMRMHQRAVSAIGKTPALYLRAVRGE